MTDGIVYEVEPDEDDYWTVTGSDGSVVASGLTEREAEELCLDLNSGEQK